MPKTSSKTLFSEMRQGYSERRIWSRLAEMAIDTQYKQNTLGPFWIAANTAVLVAAFAYVYSSVLSVNLDEHIVYVASGLICWYFYSSVILKSCTVFVVNRQLMLQLPLPVSLHIYKLLYQELLIFMYNLIVLVLVCLIFKNSIGFGLLLVVPAFLLILLNAFFVAFLCAIIATRYRDVASSMHAVIAPMMFLTPILWNADTMGSRPLFVSYNPFFHLVEIWRSPILGVPLPTNSWVFMGVYTSLLACICYILYAKYNRRITFWL